jgi:hypothetical protein
VVTLKPSKTEQILLSEQMLPVAQQFLNNYKRWWAELEKVSAVNRRLPRLRVAALRESRPTTSGEAERGKGWGERVYGLLSLTLIRMQETERQEICQTFEGELYLPRRARSGDAVRWRPDLGSSRSF